MSKKCKLSGVQRETFSSSPHHFDYAELVAQFWVWMDSQIWVLASGPKNCFFLEPQSSSCFSNGNWKYRLFLTLLLSVLGPDLFYCWKKAKRTRWPGKETLNWQSVPSYSDWVTVFPIEKRFEMPLKVKCLRSSETKMMLQVVIIKDIWCDCFRGTRGSLPEVQLQNFPFTSSSLRD